MRRHWIFSAYFIAHLIEFSHFRQSALTKWPKRGYWHKPLIHRLAFISCRGKVPGAAMVTGIRKAKAVKKASSSFCPRAAGATHSALGSIWIFNSGKAPPVLITAWYSVTPPQ